MMLMGVGALIALGVGFLTGIFGVGGGFLMTPALMILLGVPGPMSIGTGMAVMFVNSSFGMVKRRGTGTVDVKIALTIAIGNAIGVFIGSNVLEYLKYLPPITINNHQVQAVEYLLLWVFLLLLALVAGWMAFDYHRHNGQAPQQRIGLLAGVKLPPYGHFASLEAPRMSLPALVALGVAVGVLTGMMGIGGGVILLPSLIYLVGQRAAKATGTSLLLVWISSVLAVAFHITHGNIHLNLWLALTAGGLLGTALGTKIGLKINGPRLRLYFVYVILAAIALIMVKLVHVTAF